ncbi:WD-40 repeat-containing protein MSI5 isoform X1 [Aegilops tauschii subsp. strangulata]|uniref:Uncharacterized protein n=2 Tax=Aegilops tauschii subsp. strangulata TaxID=200361 RepID=A0A453KDD7_AEGTS|nr:uncharacterized protein LOC109735510 isoform X1 [Aegilops tauschii subsp. strangulata]XP_044396273.1 uncharacterized protein LOC123120369 isoform X1 [Triticum aestivum]
MTPEHDLIIDFWKRMVFSSTVHPLLVFQYVCSNLTDSSGIQGNLLMCTYSFGPYLKLTKSHAQAAPPAYGSVPNTLVIATCEIVKPRLAAAEHISQFNEDARSPFVKKYKTIIHSGESYVIECIELVRRWSFLMKLQAACLFIIYTIVGWIKENVHGSF